MMSIVRRIVAFLVFFACAASANAQSYTYSIYIDADNNAATGCNVSSPGGTLAGIESVLTITTTAGATPTVGSVTRSSCSGSALGAPVAEGSGAVSVGAGVGGTTSIELSDALANIAGASSTALHLYVVAQSASGSDVLLNTTGAAGGAPIMLALPVPGVTVPTPLFGIPAILLLGAALLALGSRAARRRMLKRMLLGLVMVSGIAGAAIFNWNGIAPLASDPAGDSTSGESAIDLRYFFAALQGSNVYFRIDVTGALTTPPVAAADSYSASFNTALTVAAPGVLGNDTLNGATITANTNPAHGTLALNANGGFVYTPASGYTGADSFTYTLTNAGGSSTATVSITVAAPAAPTVTGVAPASGPTAGGTSVTITGTNFTGATAVKFGATLSTSFTVSTATQIVAIAPAGSAGTVDVTVTTPGGTSAVSGSDKFAYFGPPASIVVASGTPQSAAVGTAFASPLVVTVRDASSNPVPGATVTFTAPASGASAALSSPAVTNASGQTQVTATANSTSGAYTVITSVSGVGTPANFALTNTTSGATHFTVSAPATATAGTAFSFTVTAQDQFNNTVTGYSGTVHFTSTDGAATLPANYTFVAGDAGAHTFSSGATLKTAGNQTLTATDTVTASITGTSGTIAVSAAAATHLTVSAPANATAGTAFSFTVTAQDQFNNTVTGYSGTAHFTSTDGAATLPANYTFVAGDAGVHIFSSGAALKTAGNQTLTATDTVTASITGTSSAITVNAAAATHFAVSAPTPATAGTAFNFTVTALDQFNNTAPAYSGTAHFTSTDGAAILPADLTLTNGVGTFPATLRTAGNQTITATDKATGSINGTSNTIAVNAAAATHFTVVAPSSAAGNTAFNLTVTALDQFNNVAAAYAGTVHFTSSDGAATLPGDSTLTGGTGTFSASLRTNGNQTVSATDTVTGSITGTSGTIVVATPPTANNDSYTTVGNTDLVVGATPPSTPYVLGAAGLLSNDTTSGATTVAVTQAPTHGAISSLNASSGAFIYTPAAGYTGIDTFKYTVTDGSTLTSAPATVTITVTGRVWYVNGAAATNGSGVSSSSLNTLATIAPSLLAGDTIFVESGGSFTTTGGAISLPASVTLWGQGTSLPTVSGITILNTAATSKPRLTGTVTLAGSNTTVSSLDINTAGVTGLTNSFSPNGVTIKNNVSVTTVGATAVNLNGVSGNLTFLSVSASSVGAGNAISVTGGTGFSVTGDGVTAGSGGTISGTCTSGTTGCGAIKLSNAGTVSLAWMSLNGTTGAGVYATDTMTTVANSSLSNFATQGIYLNATSLASGTFNLNHNNLTSNVIDAIQLQLNASGTWTGHVTANTIGNDVVSNSGSTSGDGIGIDVNTATGTGGATVDVSNNFVYQIKAGRGIIATANSGTLSVSVLNNTVVMRQPTGQDAINVGSGGPTANPSTVCLNAVGNSSTAAGLGLSNGTGFDGVGMLVGQNTASSVFKIQGYVGPATDPTGEVAPVETYLISKNTLAGAVMPPTVPDDRAFAGMVPGSSGFTAPLPACPVAP